MDAHASLSMTKVAERILGTKTRLKTNVILSKRSLREDP